MSEPGRRGLLRDYLAALASDMNASRKFSAAGTDPIETAARAIVNGGSAMAATVWSDLQALGGQAAPFVGAAIETAAAEVASRAARAGIDRIASGVSDFFDKKSRGKRDQREVGRRFMEAAQKMGR